MVPSGTSGGSIRSWIWRAPPVGAALEEREAVGVEEDAVALGQPHRARLGAVVDHAEEDEELRPGAVALVHRVREERGVLAQALVEARERVVAQERLVLGQHVPLLGVEQEDEPQDDGEQRAVDLVGVLGERLAQQLALRGVVRGLEAAQQLVERVQHLLGQALADLVLELAAVLEQGGEALRARQAEEPRLAEEQAQRGARSAGPRSAPCPRRGSRASPSSRRGAPRRGAARGR